MQPIILSSMSISTTPATAMMARSSWAIISKMVRQRQADLCDYLWRRLFQLPNVRLGARLKLYENYKGQSCQFVSWIWISHAQPRRRSREKISTRDTFRTSPIPQSSAARSPTMHPAKWRRRNFEGAGKDAEINCRTWDVEGAPAGCPRFIVSSPVGASAPPTSRRDAALLLISAIFLCVRSPARSTSLPFSGNVLQS